MNAALALDTLRQPGASPVTAVQQGQVITFTLAEDVPGIGKAGQRVTMAATPADTSDQTRELETYLGGYRPFGFAADQMSPVVLIDKEQGKRRDFDMENAFEVVETRTGRQGQINEIQHLSSTVPYKTEEHALAAFVQWAAANDAVSTYDVRAAHSDLLALKLALSREVRVITKLTATASWNAANYTTLTTNYKWDTGTSKTPRKDLHDRISASMQPVSGIYMNPDVGFFFLSDNDTRDYLRQMMGDNAPDPELALAAEAQGVVTFRLVGFPPITVCPAKRIPAGGGTPGYILGDDVLLLCTPPGGVPLDGNRIATSYTFRTRGRSGTGFTVNEYIPNGRGLEGGTMYENGYKETIEMTSSIAGGLIKDVLST